MTAPESILQTIAVEDDAKRQQFIICHGFAKMFQQFSPTFRAWTAHLDSIQRCCQLHFSLPFVFPDAPGRLLSSTA